MAYWGGAGAGGWSGGAFGQGMQRLRRSNDGWDDDEDYGAVYNHRVVSRLLPYLRPYKGRALLALAGTIIYTITTSVQPFLIGKLIRYATLGQLMSVNRVGALFLALVLISWAAQYIDRKSVV